MTWKLARSKPGRGRAEMQGSSIPLGRNHVSPSGGPLPSWALRIVLTFPPLTAPLDVSVPLQVLRNDGSGTWMSPLQPQCCLWCEWVSSANCRSLTEGSLEVQSLVSVLPDWVGCPIGLLLIGLDRRITHWAGRQNFSCFFLSFYL